MSWYKERSSDNTHPAEVDETSSHFVVFVRKDFKEVEWTDPETGETKTVWEWMETKIPKEDWEVYKQCLENTQDITDLQLALVDVYEMVIGG